MRDIKADILNSARELFCSKGFKDTNVSDIAKMSGIGVGTIYNYYSSKEKLFLEIYVKENEIFKKSMDESINLNGDPVALIIKLVGKNVDEMNSNLILKEWYNRELFGKLEQHLYEQNDFEGTHESINSLTVQLIKKWKAEGQIRHDIDDEMMIAIFNSIFYINFHKSEIGIQHFPKILHYITEFIMKGLVNCTKKTK